MTKIEARERGYCKHCAGWNLKQAKWSCGVTSQETITCLLPPEVIERWKVEHGLEGTKQRIPAKDAFGSEDYMKKRRGFLPYAQARYKRNEV